MQRDCNIKNKVEITYYCKVETPINKHPLPFYHHNCFIKYGSYLLWKFSYSISDKSVAEEEIVVPMATYCILLIFDANIISTVFKNNVK